MLVSESCRCLDHAGDGSADLRDAGKGTVMLVSGSCRCLDHAGEGGVGLRDAGEEMQQRLQLR
eukprot:784835-Pelagomonas_calceolata.AAC.1